MLEVGAGSGYAAAVISRIAAKVIAIERQHDLVEIARERMRRLGYDNVEIVEGDGTRGCPDEAPFDAIVAAASGSHVPKAFIDQLSARRADRDADRRPRLGRRSWSRSPSRRAGKLVQENLGGVRFVPLIGEQGWSDA